MFHGAGEVTSQNKSVGSFQTRVLTTRFETGGKCCQRAPILQDPAGANFSVGNPEGEDNRKRPPAGSPCLISGSRNLQRFPVLRDTAVVKKQVDNLVGGSVGNHLPEFFVKFVFSEPIASIR
jgi:hypothetical protein